MESRDPRRQGLHQPTGSDLYDEEYYETHCSRGSDGPYRHGNSNWEQFYGAVADNIVRSLNPDRVYDAGCAIGFLVEALWARGVETWGRDISEYAIGQVRLDVRDYCSVGSITDPVDGHFDLVLCVEVLEHLAPSDALLAIKQLTSVTDQILVSSSPDDFDEPTHINVRPPIYWIRQFAAHGFAPVLSYDATYLCPHAMLFRRFDQAPGEEPLLAAAELVRVRVAEAAQRRRAIELNIQLSEALEAKWRAETGRNALLREKAAADAERDEMVAQAARLDHQLADLNADLNHVAVERATLERRLQSMESNFTWRATAILRALADALPAGFRTAVKRLARLLYRTLTLKVLFDRRRPPVAGPASPDTVDGPAGFLTAEEAVPAQPAKFHYLEPLRVFRSPEGQPTVNVVTDSIAAGSLFGGVATALILASRLAERVGARLRIVTRTEPGDAADVARLLSVSDLPADLDIVTVFSPPGGGSAVPMSERDYFIPTSWWTVAATVSAIGHDRVVYLLQEDERMFYPMGDEYLRCSETLNDERLRTVINTNMLLRHLTGGSEPVAALGGRSIAFEPAFPAKLFYDDEAARNAAAKLDFVFYARPNNIRNLYWRGLEAIERAINDGTLPPDRWRFVFLGKDIGRVDLPGDPEIVVGQNLALDDYARYVRRATVGLTLIYSPHPSYPPLDLAASGAVVVTNTFDGVKVDLSEYSQNIFCVPPTVEALGRAISDAVALAGDPVRRRANMAAGGMGRDWVVTLEPVVDRILQWCDGDAEADVHRA